MKKKTKIVVEVVSHDRWDGIFLRKKLIFLNRGLAKSYVTRWNKFHCPPRSWDNIPDYYIEAHIKA